MKGVMNPFRFQLSNTWNALFVERERMGSTLI